MGDSLVYLDNLLWEASAALITAPSLLPRIVFSVMWHDCGDQKSKSVCSTGIHITVIIGWMRILIIKIAILACDWFKKSPILH